MNDLILYTLMSVGLVLATVYLIRQYLTGALACNCHTCEHDRAWRRRPGGGWGMR